MHTGSQPRLKESQRKQTWPPRLLKRKTADLFSVSTQLYQGGIAVVVNFEFSLHFLEEK